MKMTNKLLQIEENDPKAFWRMINDMRNFGTGTKDACDNVKPSNWYEHFNKLLNKQIFDKQSEAETEKFEKLEKEPFFNGSGFRISEEEVSKAINALKRNKSPGPDNLVSEFIISGRDLLLSPICNIFNLVFRTVAYPTQWTKSFLKPMHKKGAQSNPDNYQGIAIGSCLGKLYRLVVLKS